MTTKRPAFAELHRMTSRQHNHSTAPTYTIEGEPVTMRQIAERLGIRTHAAASRWRAATKKPGPVTWARLGLADTGKR